MSKLSLPTVPTSGLFKQGYQTYQSEDGVLNKNIAAVREISSMIRTSVGPSGRNKIIVNNIQKVFLTSDASTILRELEIIHPAVKLVVMASQQQDFEYGDCSNLVVVLAGELLSQAEELLRIGMSPSEIVEGFEKAKVHALDALNEIESSPDLPLDVVLKSVIASKQFGYEGFIEKLVAEAVDYVFPPDATNFNVDNIRVVKIMGASLLSSKVIKGMVFNGKPEGSVDSIQNGAKVAAFTAPFDISQTETKGTVLLHNAQEMLDFSKGEESQMEEFVKNLSATGVKVVLCGSGLGSLALHYLNKYDILAFRVGSKFDLLRLSRVTGCSLLPTMRLPTPAEVGEIDVVEVEEIGGDRVTVFKQNQKTSKTSTIILRGATQNLLDDVERAINDGTSAVKSLTKGRQLVPGAGSAEISVASAVFSAGEHTPGTLQYAIKAYAKAFEVVPRTLAENAGLDGTEVISNLYASSKQSESRTKSAGVDVDGEQENGLIDAEEAGIWDIAVAKKSAVELATEAANTVLTVNQIIMAKRAGGPAMPKMGGGDWDQD